MSQARPAEPQGVGARSEPAKRPSPPGSETSTKDRREVTKGLGDVTPSDGAYWQRIIERATD